MLSRIMKNIAKFDLKPEDIGFNIGGYELGLQPEAVPTYMLTRSPSWHQGQTRKWISWTG